MKCNHTAQCKGKLLVFKHGKKPLGFKKICIDSSYRTPES